MRKIKAQKLTKEAFAPFGTYYDVLKPEGAHLGDFYQDHVIDPVAFGVPMGFSALVAHKAEKMIVKGSEYHNYTGEVMIRWTEMSSSMSRRFPRNRCRRKQRPLSSRRERWCAWKRESGIWGSSRFRRKRSICCWLFRRERMSMTAS
jgi:hypothetical protein